MDQTRSPSEPFSHPESGELIETHQGFMDALTALEERMQPLYRLRRQLRVGMADRFPAPDMPRPRERTVTHPETGEILSARAGVRGRARRDVEERMQPLYVLRRQLRVGMADRFPAPEMPRPRERTVTQERVARCPRCGGTLESEEPPEGGSREQAPHDVASG